jgi:hypothetical protein
MKGLLVFRRVQHRYNNKNALMKTDVAKKTVVSLDKQKICIRFSPFSSQYRIFFYQFKPKDANRHEGVVFIWQHLYYLLSLVLC